jgi:hypothetical protein
MAEFMLRDNPSPTLTVESYKKRIFSMAKSGKEAEIALANTEIELARTKEEFEDKLRSVLKEAKEGRVMMCKAVTGLDDERQRMTRRALGAEMYFDRIQKELEERGLPKDLLKFTDVETQLMLGEAPENFAALMDQARGQRGLDLDLEAAGADVDAFFNAHEQPPNAALPATSEKSLRSHMDDLLAEDDLKLPAQGSVVSPPTLPQIAPPLAAYRQSLPTLMMGLMEEADALPLLQRRKVPPPLPVQPRRTLTPVGMPIPEALLPRAPKPPVTPPPLPPRLDITVPGSQRNPEVNDDGPSIEVEEAAHSKTSEWGFARDLETADKHPKK